MVRRDSRTTEPSETSPLLRPALATSITPQSIVPPSDAEEQIASAPAEDVRQYEGIPEARRNFRYSFPALLIGVFLAAMDQTLVATSWSKIGSELHALNSTSWISTAYLATVISCHPLYGAMSDIFGRKPCILTAYVLFGLGTVLCGFAKDIKQLALARAIAGAGGGGMSSLVVMILADVAPLRERPSYMVYISFVWFAGTSTGAPVGGILADVVSWRWSFWMQVPIVVLAFVAVYFALDYPQQKTTGDGTEADEATPLLSRLDITGSILLVTSIGLLLVTLDLGSNHSWTSTRTLAAGGTTVPIVLLFLYVELYGAKSPVLPLRLVLTRATIPVHIASNTQHAALAAFDMFVPLYLISVHRWTVSEAAVAAIPRTIGVLVGSLIAARYIKRTGKYYWFMLVTRFLTAFGYIVMLLSVIYIKRSADMILVSAFTFTAVFGAASSSLNSTAILAVTAYSNQAVMLGATYFFRSLGSVVGVGSSATIVNTVLRKSLAASIDGGRAEEIADRVRRNLDYLESLPTQLANIVVASYAKAVASSFVLNVGMITIACVCCVFYIEKPLDRPGRKP